MMKLIKVPVTPLPILLNADAKEALEAKIKEEIAKYEAEAEDIRAYVQSLIITDLAQANDAIAYAKGLKEMVKTRTAVMEPAINDLHKFHKVLTTFRGVATAGLTEGADKLEAGVRKWKADEERKRADEAARRQRDIEAQQRKEREEHEAAIRKQQEDERIAEALNAEKQGYTDEEIEEILTAPPEPVYMPPVQRVITSAAPVKISGLRNKKVSYTGKVVDIKTLCRAIAEGRIPSTIIDVNQGQLNKLVNIMPGVTIPGVVVSKDI